MDILLFNSYEFIFVFLPLTLTVYFVLARSKLVKLAIAWLVTASLAFYAYWDIRYLLLLLTSILFNFTAGSFIEKTKSKKFLTAAIAVNLCLLGYYKYTGFIIGAVNQAVGASLPVPEIVLPLGISFFTFTQTAYLIDAWRGETKRYSLLDYSLFVTVFPHLIAGPILYHKDMIPQFSRLKNFVFSYKNIAAGVCLFAIGLFKKVIVADNLSIFANITFSAAAQGIAPNLPEAWLGALSYSLQLYFDFSGYSDMAIGLGLMFNLKLPVNFNSPYKATSIIDFWRRWHMTLSAFLKNYLYIPLGGNKHGEYARLKNLMITMLLGGLWHGAGWNFIVWGGLHGLYLVINHIWRGWKITMPNGIAWGLTFVSVVIAWVFFRTDSLHSALLVINGMFGGNWLSLPLDAQFSAIKFSYERALIWLAFSLYIMLILPNHAAMFRKHTCLPPDGGEAFAELLKPFYPCDFIIGVMLTVGVTSLSFNIPYNNILVWAVFSLYVVFILLQYTRIFRVNCVLQQGGANAPDRLPQPSYLWAVIISFMFVVSLLSLTQESEFLYFQF